jgi:hypothetical protein
MGDSAITRRSSSRLVAQQQAKALKTTSAQTTGGSSSSLQNPVNTAAKGRIYNPPIFTVLICILSISEVVDADLIQKLSEKYDKGLFFCLLICIFIIC